MIRRPSSVLIIRPVYVTKRGKAGHIIRGRKRVYTTPHIDQKHEPTEILRYVTR